MNLKKMQLAVTACMILLSTLLLFSCGSKPAAKPVSGRMIFPAAQDKDGATKILLYYDMEGISGVNNMKCLSFGNEEYKQAREWLTNDVNAVIDGLFAGGADAVDVVDGHGSGNPDPDVLLDKMDSRAKMVSRDKSFRAYVDLTEKGIYDAVAVVCMHSKTGGRGFAAHTYTIGMEWILNDMSINETEIIAYSWGRADVPVIFAAGDDKLAEQLKWMDWLQYAIVKKARGAGDAELIPFEQVHKEMTEAAKRAVENLPNAKAVKLALPIKAQLRAVYPARLDQLEGVPGIDYKDQTVTFSAKSYREAYDGITALIGVATRGYIRVLNEVIREKDKNMELREAMWRRLDEIWVEVESGLWKAPPRKKPDTKKSYFGVQ